MPKVFQLAEEKNYLRRMTMLFQINYLMSSQLLEKVLSPLIKAFLILFYKKTSYNDFWENNFFVSIFSQALNISITRAIKNLDCKFC